MKGAAHEVSGLRTPNRLLCARLLYGSTLAPHSVQNFAPGRRGFPQLTQNRRTRGDTGGPLGLVAAAEDAPIDLPVRSRAACVASNVTAVTPLVLIQKLW